MSNEFLLEALRASKHQHADGSTAAFLRLVERDESAHRDDAAYRDALAAMIPAVGAAAKHKNVPIDQSMYAVIARLSLEEMTTADMCDLLEVRRHAVEQAQLAISYQLDIYAAYQVTFIIATREGRESADLTDELHKAREWVEEGRADPSQPTVRIWPDLFETADAHYAALRASRETTDA